MKHWKNEKGEIHREDGPAIELSDRYKEWWITSWKNDKGEIHREDGPAIEYPNGDKYWYLNDKLHRLDGPAIEGSNGYKEWFLNGKRHRLDGPAIELVNGYKVWYIEGVEYTEEEFKLKVAEMNKDKPTTIDSAGNKYWKNDKGQYHREDGPAIESFDGSKYWYINGKLSRENGPSYEEASGYKAWHLNGLLHRIDGPAIEYSNGSKEWCIEGAEYTEEEFNLKVAEMNKDKPTRIDDDGNKIWENDKGQFHREDGPAIEGFSGYKAWYLNGQRHREDGPAVEDADGYKEWWVNGKLHRLDGPAFEGVNGTKSWYVNGDKLHREDGPAIEYPDGTKEWYLNDQLHRIDGPAIECSDGYKAWYIDGVEYTEEEFKLKLAEMNKDKPTTIDENRSKYWKNAEGKLHRIDGPAYEGANGSKGWYVNGLLHRLDGPACEYADGSKLWWVNDKLHRIDGPAIEKADGRKYWYLDGMDYSEERFKLIIAEMNKYKPTEVDAYGTKYWKNDKGQLHREDGSAVEYADGTKQWYLNGKPHRIDGPAVEGANGTKQWWINGKCHREDGPAKECSDGSKEWWINGVNYSEEEFKLKVAKMNKDEPTTIDKDGNKFWKNDKGQYHREDGPAIESVDGSKYWYINGKLSRENGPACEYADGTKRWYINGQRHREDGPAYEGLDGHKEWWVNGLRHRIDGPAIEYAFGTKLWYIEGINYSEKDFNLKVAEMNKDKPTRIDDDGNKFWENDKGDLHREDGPAREFADGSRSWHVNGELHRLDGPACEWDGGYKEWYIDGIEYSEIDFKIKVDEMNKEKNTTLNLSKLEKRIEDLEKIIKEKDAIIEEKTSLIEVNTKNKIFEPTTTLLSNVGINSMKLVGARQTSRIMVGLVRFILVNIAKKMGKDNYEEYIDSEAGKVMLEIISPLVIHSLAANNFFPKFAEQIEAVSKLSVEANITYYSLHYSDKISDITKEIISNNETREQIKNLINIGSDIINPDKKLDANFENTFEKIMA